ncbi:MAG: hypothetical protein VX228_11060, partial [Pseudomonadota bacterium]|nr:hypothetical protein [Pseudomonadota bacterium]
MAVFEFFARSTGACFIATGITPCRWIVFVKTCQRFAGWLWSGLRWRGAGLGLCHKSLLTHLHLLSEPHQLTFGNSHVPLHFMSKPFYPEFPNYNKHQMLHLLRG